MAESTRSTHAKWTSSLVVAVEYGGCRFIIWIGCSVHRGHGRRPTARVTALQAAEAILRAGFAGR